MIAISAGSRALLRVVIVAFAALVSAGVPGARTSRVASRPLARGQTSARAASSGTTYYVAPNGSDANSGTSANRPWRTVERVNSAPLKPGDRVLFRGAARFSDSDLEPDASGTAGASISYGSYGTGQAHLTYGVWFNNHDDLTFDNLALGPQDGFQGGSNYGPKVNHIVLENSTISLSAHNADVGVYSNGNDWTIKGNKIENIGNSGMLLNGDRYTISGNTITNVGLDSAIRFDKHGIYLVVSNATVTDNHISHFQADGISPRMRNSTISGNVISNGEVGIGFFEQDRIGGTSHWTHNTITGTTLACVYIDGRAGGLLRTHESFVVTYNTLRPARGPAVRLVHTTGTYLARENRR